MKPLATIDAALEGQPAAPASLLVTAAASAIIVVATTLVAVVLFSIKGVSAVPALWTGSIWAAVFLLAAVVWRPVLGYLLRVAHGTASSQARKGAFMIANLGAIVAFFATTTATVISFWLPSPWVTIAACFVATLWISGPMVRCLLRFNTARWLPAAIVALSSLALIGEGYLALSPRPNGVPSSADTGASAAEEPHAAAPPVAPVAAPTSAPIVPTTAIDAEANRYAEYVRKREAIEKTVKANPLKLKRVEGALALYDKLQIELAKIEKKSKRLAKLHAKASATALQEAESYERTTTLVDELYQKLVE